MRSITQLPVCLFLRTVNIFSVQQQGKNTVTMYAVDQETGLLTKKFTLPISGDYPKDLMIFPDNKHIAIANHASNSITVFTVDYEKNIIMMNEKPRKIETPNCIHIWPVPDTWEQLD